MSRSCAVTISTALCLLVTGCAPARFVEGVRYVADRHGVRSADTFGVAHRGYLRFDHALLSDLDDVLTLDDADRIHADGRRVLEHAHSLATRAIADEVRRMPPKALDELDRQYRLKLTRSDVDARRADVNGAFATCSRTRLDGDLARLEATTTAAQARRFLRAIRRDVELSPGDRGKVARALLGAPLYLPAAIGAEIADAEATERLLTADFEHVIRYELPDRPSPGDAVDLKNADPATLAVWYAPVFIQQIDPNAEYAGDADRIGRVFLTGAPGNIAVHVDTSEPIVYWTHQQAKVGSQRYAQLVYVAWYPRRPALAANDPSAGDIDGMVVRITLDRHHRPAIYEFVRSCGCYHTLWVAEFVEAAARAEYGGAGERQTYAVQREDVDRELFIPALVRDDGTGPHRPIVFVNAGHHLVMTIHPLTDEPLLAKTQEHEAYRLEPYDVLTHLPLGDGVASMFGSDGLVHNAGRAEGWLLAPTGMLSAGQPRQLGTMKIRMDAYDYDDPRLLERNLRLPHSF